MTDPTTPAHTPAVLPEPVASIIAGLNNVTPGPWDCLSGYLIRSIDGEEAIPIAEVREPWKKHRRATKVIQQSMANAAHFARCDPDTMRTIAAQMRAALDRAERAESEFAKIAIHLDAEFDSISVLHEIMEIQADLDIFRDRAIAAEAALTTAENDALERAAEALEPYCVATGGHFVVARRVVLALKKETPNAE